MCLTALPLVNNYKNKNYRIYTLKLEFISFFLNYKIFLKKKTRANFFMIKKIFYI